MAVRHCIRESNDAQMSSAEGGGFLDVQRLTCAQLAGTWQQDADALMTWYSGWYNGLAKKHFFHMSRAKQLEHEVISLRAAQAWHRDGPE